MPSIILPKLLNLNMIKALDLADYLQVTEQKNTSKCTMKMKMRSAKYRLWNSTGQMAWFLAHEF